MNTVFHVPRSQIGTTLAAPYSPGGTTLTVAGGYGANFGSPSPTAPQYVTVFKPSAIDAIGRVTDPSGWTVFEITGRTGDVLTGASVVAGYADQSFAAGSKLYGMLTPEHLTELQEAIVALEEGGGGGGTELPDQTGNAGKLLTTNGTDPAWTSVIVAQASSASVIPLTVKAASGQTAALLEWANASGTRLGCVSKDGYVGIGNVASPPAPITISNGTQTVTIGIQSGNRGIQLGGGSANEVFCTGQMRSDGGFNTSTTTSGTSLLSGHVGKANGVQGIKFPGDGSNGGYILIQGETQPGASAVLLAAFYPQGTNAGSFIYSPTASATGLRVRGAASQSGNLTEWQASGGTTLGAIRPDASWKPPAISDSSAVNDSVYYSTTQSKLAYKDPAGVVHVLS